MKHVEALSFKERYMRVGDGAGGWRILPAECRFLHDKTADTLMPFGVAQMDNSEVLFLGSAETAATAEKPRLFEPVTSISGDGGDTWSELARIPEVPSGRPMMLTDLGRGNLCFQIAGGATSSCLRMFSHDYGRTWDDRLELTAPEGEAWGVEGNPLVDYDDAGHAMRIAEIGYKSYSAKVWPGAFEGYIRWSADDGRTWGNEVKPASWMVEKEWQGERYPRGVSEGSLTRAQNGWLVAGLRLDMPPRFYAGGAAYVDFDDSLEGLAISISRDDGRTWSAMNELFEAGRHHPHLMTLPNGDILMTYIVRDDVRNGRLASYHRGCEALLSHDNGITWDTRQRYVLDEFAFFDGKKWCNGETGHLYSTRLADGRILTIYGNYLSKGACLIRWKP